MLTVHHLSHSQSERIVWLCEELAVPYRLIRYDRDPVTRLAPPAYKALHPLGTAPIVQDGDILLPESGAIIEYIIHTYGQGRLAVAPGAPDYAGYLFWWHFANASLMPSAMIDGLVARLGGTNDPVARALQARHDLAYGQIESRLAAVPYFAGDVLTAADIVMLFPLTTMRRFSGRDIKPYPNLGAYLRRIGEQAAYRRAMAKCEPETPPLTASP